MNVFSLASYAVPRALQPIGRYWRHRLAGTLDPEMEWLFGRMRTRRTFVDVGANFGVFTHAAHRRNFQVAAFEPFPDCVAILRAYARAHSDVMIHNVALGAAHGTATLHVPRSRARFIPALGTLREGTNLPGLRVENFRVDVAPLDAFALRNVGALKIDVEGYEFDVLAGARETIARERPLILVELNARYVAEPFEAAFRRFEALGYHGEYLDDDLRPAPVASYVLAEHQRINGLRNSKRSIMNFLWTPNDG